MGKLASRIKNLRDYPGNKNVLLPPSGKSSETSAEPSQKEIVGNRIASITPEDIINRMGGSIDTDDIGAAITQLNGNSEGSDTLSMVLPGTGADQQQPAPLFDDLDKEGEISTELLLNFNVRQDLPEVPMLDMRGSIANKPFIEFKPSDTLDSTPMRPDSQPHNLSFEVDKMSAFEQTESTSQSTAQVLDFSMPEQYTEQQIQQYYDNVSQDLRSSEYSTSSVQQGDVVIHRLYDSDVIPMEVTLMDINGRISDLINSHQEKSGRLVIPIKMTNIPEPVMPSRHNVMKLGGELYFTPHQTEVQARTEGFLTDCLRELELGNRLEKQIITEFDYNGQYYSAPMFTSQELTYILSSLRKYNANLHESVGSLKLVAGEY